LHRGDRGKRRLRANKKNASAAAAAGDGAREKYASPPPSYTYKTRRQPSRVDAENLSRPEREASAVTTSKHVIKFVTLQQYYHGRYSVLYNVHKYT